MNVLIKEKFLNFISTFVFLITFAASIYLFINKQISIDDISIFDLVVLVLSTYRVSRMIVYEKVFSFLRYLIRKNSYKGLFNSINNLIVCPWCTSVWIGLFMFDIYYLIPYGDYFVYIVSISAVASPLILLSNNMTLRNDILKKQRDKDS